MGKLGPVRKSPNQKSKSVDELWVYLYFEPCIFISIYSKIFFTLFWSNLNTAFTVLKITLRLMGLPFMILGCEMGESDGPPWLLIYMVMADIMDFDRWLLSMIAIIRGMEVDFSLEIDEIYRVSE